MITTSLTNTPSQLLYPLFRLLQSVQTYRLCSFVVFPGYNWLFRGTHTHTPCGKKKHYGLFTMHVLQKWTERGEGGVEGRLGRGGGGGITVLSMSKVNKI